MSGNANITEVLRVLQNAEKGGGVDGLLRAEALGGLGGARAAGAKPDPKALAFQIEMRMAQQAMRAMDGGEDRESSGMLGLDNSLLNDAMLMDALSTMAKLTGQEPPAAAPAQAVSPEKALTRNPSAQGLGSLAAKFESGDKGAAAIGFDRTGGTSYGKYQISSKAGTMNRFLNFLAEREPAWAQRLRGSGPANTGSVQGRMPA
jgi:hypothetical protein